MSGLLNILNFQIPRSVRVSSIIEIIILAYLIYHLIKLVKDTRAWTLIRGILVIFIFAILAYVFNLSTLTWLISNLAAVFITIVAIIFQPELRRALEKVGTGQYFSRLFGIRNLDENSLKDRAEANNEIIRAVYEMSKVRTGALIVIERQVKLSEYETTGIELDAKVTSSLLINIFEKNTPLHDGAVIIRDNRITAATCYLPLTEEKNLSKELGTRHRAGIGISEISDCFVIIVSEETGKVSTAEGGKIEQDVSQEELRNKLNTDPALQTSAVSVISRLRGKKSNNEGKTDS
ncbi:MAG: diadenylate cyclase CdaA [Lachnospiraceae bacterium]|nr:diadenylate cyclase CdaA [Lachnospiraceae bacterium]